MSYIYNQRFISVYTVDGHKCDFPFTMDSATHYGCIANDDNEEPWCSLEDTSINDGWGKCDLESTTISVTKVTTGEQDGTTGDSSTVSHADAKYSSTEGSLEPARPATSAPITTRSHEETVMRSTVTTQGQTRQGSTALAATHTMIQC